MWKLRLFDRNGMELNEGDIVRISGDREIQFYSEVKYLGGGAIAPFSTFSFHSVEKVDNLPLHAVKCSEERYNIWYINPPDNDDLSGQHEQYLLNWRECEHLLAMFKIEP